MNDSQITPATAVWNQRFSLLGAKKRLKSLFDAVDSPNELNLYQWAQLYAYVREFKPDLVLELGREMGNSTCAFVEAAQSLAGICDCRVISICWSEKFKKVTIPRLTALDGIDENWFSRLDCRIANILMVDYGRLLSPFSRILVFWDAHGFEIAGCVLGRILPIIQERDHCLLMHDLSDQRHMSKDLLSYNGRGLWCGDSHSEARLVLGHVNSSVAQAISIVDFCNRNGIDLESADHTFHEELLKNGKAEEMRRLLGEKMFSLQGHWFYFSLNTHSGPFTFPNPEPA